MPVRGDEGRAEMRGLFAMTNPATETQEDGLAVRCPECGRFAARVNGTLTRVTVEMICADHRCRAMFIAEVLGDGSQSVKVLRKARRA